MPEHDVMGGNRCAAPGTAADGSAAAERYVIGGG